MIAAFVRTAAALGLYPFPGRRRLTGARTYYVRADGSDSNSGLVNSAGGAFATVQKAIDTVAALDLATYQATIQIASGTYTGQLILRPTVGSLPPIIIGDEGTPSNVNLNWTNADLSLGTVHNDAAGVWHVRGVKIGNTTATGIRVINGGTVKFQNVEFGGGATFHIYVGANSTAEATGNYAVSAGGNAHVAASGWFICNGRTVTVTGTPSFSGGFVRALRGGIIENFGSTFVGTATGKYYDANQGDIFTNGGGATYFPGNAAGTVSNGSYV